MRNILSLQLTAAYVVSHEWLSLGHADPQGEQLRELQRLLIRMMKVPTNAVIRTCTEACDYWQGEVNGQHPEVKSKSGLHVLKTEEVTREEWAASLPFSFIWLDFLSIPQVNCFRHITRIIKS